MRLAALAYFATEIAGQSNQPKMMNLIELIATVPHLHLSKRATLRDHGIGLAKILSWVIIDLMYF